jgi:hypothetical protein
MHVPLKYTSGNPAKKAISSNISIYSSNPVPIYDKNRN